MNTTARIVCSLILLLGGISHSMSAQSSPLTFGIRAGAGVSFLLGTYYSWDFTEAKFLVDKFNGFSFNGGGLMNISLSDNWSIQPELLYTLESAKETVHRINDNGTLDTLTNITSMYRTSTIRIPITIKWSIGEPKAGQFSILAGPSIGYLLSMKESNEFNPIFNKETPKEYDWTPITTHFHVGALVGAEYRILDNLFVDGRYSCNYMSAGFNVSYSNLQIGVGYLF
jgi:hypothetical protein